MPAPLRFLVIHHPLGTQHQGSGVGADLWRPTPTTATTTNFTLPQNSAPFEPLRAKMVMIDGLNIVTAVAGRRRQQRRPEHPRGRHGRAS